MKTGLYLFMFILLLSSCGSRKNVRNNKQIEKVAKKTTSEFKNYTTLSYIEEFKAVAVSQMNSFGIPASIILAQGILESGSGNSTLARFANNHFGIKCTSEWKGAVYYKDDDKRDDCFRVYKDAHESFKDHSNFLKRKRYAFLFELDKNDYKNWASGLKQAGYATNPKYPELLIRVIEKYKLYMYDQAESETEKIKREDRVFSEINANIPKEDKKFTPVTPPPGSAETIVPADGYYSVQPGDTLFGISKRFKLTVDELKLLNKLQDTNIKIGQKLLVVK